MPYRLLPRLSSRFTPRAGLLTITAAASASARPSAAQTIASRGYASTANSKSGSGNTLFFLGTYAVLAFLMVINSVLTRQQSNRFGRLGCCRWILLLQHHSNRADQTISSSRPREDQEGGLQPGIQGHCWITWIQPRVSFVLIFFSWEFPILKLLFAIATTMDLTALFFFDLPGTRQEPTTRSQRLAVATVLPCVRIIIIIWVILHKTKAETNLFFSGFEPEALHGANNGLKVARDLLEKIHAKYPDISYGDLWTLAGVCAIQELVGILFSRIWFESENRLVTQDFIVGWTANPMETWTSGCSLCRILHSRRPFARCNQERRPYPWHLLPHGKAEAALLRLQWDMHCLSWII